LPGPVVTVLEPPVRTYTISPTPVMWPTMREEELVGVAKVIREGFLLNP
jgi:hypothetical protein